MTDQMAHYLVPRRFVDSADPAIVAFAQRAVAGVVSVMLSSMRKEPPKTGNEELDRLVTSEVAKTEGFLLRSVSETVSVSGKKGKKRNTSRSVTEITELYTKRSIPDSTFTFPRDEYQKVEMAPLPQDEEGGNPLKGLFGGGNGR
jgi:hypothetical protein